jgi:LmbE family N-acetylglucosaminyl deacetylase
VIVNAKKAVGSKIILVVVAHRDDEVLGLGGTIARHNKNGDKVYAVSMTDGISSRAYDSRQISVRNQASIKASNILGFEWLDEKIFPDNAMDSVPLIDVVRVLERVKLEIKPNLVYTHSVADLNIDHRVICNATLTAFRPQPEEMWNEIRSFEVPSSTDYGHKSITGEFNPNLYIDIAETWDLKLSALKEYSLEMRSAPHARSYQGLLNLASYRGNQVGLCCAEAFEIIRKIERS